MTFKSTRDIIILIIKNNLSRPVSALNLGEIMKSSHKKWFIILISIIALVLVFYFSYTSHVNTTVNNNNSRIHTDSSTNLNKKKNNKKNQSKKSKSNIFLQDSNTPDRIIAINPFGTKGIYQYRKQSNGDIYPEFKIFNGKIYQQGNTMKIIPSNSKNGKPIILNSNKNGTYKDSNSNDSYNIIKVNNNNDASKDHSNSNQNTAKATNTSNNDHNNNWKMDGSESYQEYYGKISNNFSDPSKSSTAPRKYYQYNMVVDPNNYGLIDTSDNSYWGNNYDQFDVNSYNRDDLLFRAENKEDVMSYRQNNTSSVSDKDLLYIDLYSAKQNNQLPGHYFQYKSGTPNT
jgi:hypothetical protein